MIAYKQISIHDELRWQGEELYRGFSWVNLAPVASGWYGTDEEIMKNTYEEYLAHCSVIYEKDGEKFRMLDACCKVEDDNRVIKYEDHVIGKGLAWELYYLYKTENYERLREMLKFIDVKSISTYPENYRLSGDISDNANQEQASWLIYEIARILGICKL